jgi:hypothetical protein
MRNAWICTARIRYAVLISPPSARSTVGSAFSLPAGGGSEPVSPQTSGAEGRGTAVIEPQFRRRRLARPLSGASRGERPVALKGSVDPTHFFRVKPHRPYSRRRPSVVANRRGVASGTGAAIGYRSGSSCSRCPVVTRGSSAAQSCAPCFGYVTGADLRQGGNDDRGIGRFGERRV